MEELFVLVSNYQLVIEQQSKLFLSLSTQPLPKIDLFSLFLYT